MMKILQFKLGGDYDYNVVFETSFEKKKIQTNDSPTGDLLRSVSDVVFSAVDYFRFENIAAGFRQITFSYPERGIDCFVLELTVKTKENIYLKHTLKSEKIALTETDESSNVPDAAIRIQQQNKLVEKVLSLREEIENYANGARSQQDLDFDEDDNSEDDDGGSSLFDDDEDGNPLNEMISENEVKARLEKGVGTKPKNPRAKKPAKVALDVGDELNISTREGV